MEIRALILRKLTVYIQTEVDQLCEEVTDFCEHTQFASDDYDTAVWSDVIVNYRVHPDIDRSGGAAWHFRGNLEQLIRELDGMKEEE